MTQVHNDPDRRHDAVLLFDVTDGNPNGDPDAGNMPRVDPETMNGLVSDVAIKRKVRDWVHTVKGDAQGFRIYVQNESALNTLHEEAYKAEGIKSTGSKQESADVSKIRNRMCANYFDIRTFGAVMTTGINAGQVRGPVQVTFARSIDPIMPLDMTITRIAVTKADDLVTVSEDGTTKGKQSEMGRKPMIPYGLYRANVFVNPLFAKQTKFTDGDLELVWAALVNMWDLDRSSARGTMSCRGLYVFSHTSPWGDAPAQMLFDRIRIRRNDTSQPARAFSDYTVDIDAANLGERVTLADLSALAPALA